MKLLNCPKPLLLVLIPVILFSCSKTNTDVQNSVSSASGEELSVSSLKTGLVAYYPFTGDAKDRSGNRNNGKVHKAILTTDRFGTPNSAYLFNGFSSYIRIADDSLFDLTNNFSISTWFKMNQYASTYNVSMIVSKVDGDIGSGGFTYGIWNPNHNNTTQIVNFQANDHFNTDTYPDTSGIVSTNQWYNFIVTYDNLNAILKYYLNGNLILSKNLQFNVLTNDLDVNIGYSKSTYGTYLDYFNGSIDEVRIYNRVLSQPEVNNLYTH